MPRRAPGEEPDEVAEVEVGGPEVLVRIEAHDRVEVVGRERELVGFGVHRVHEVLDARGPDADLVLLGHDPEIRGPHLGAELAG